MTFNRDFNELTRTLGGDKVFNLPLPTLVEGETPAGEAFQEKTILNYISHQGAIFELKNPVTIGSRLRLAIDLPKALAEDKNLKLIIRGQVILVERLSNRKNKQRITIKFENKYFIREKI
ncbi:MAG: PilZ domain-containing protein [Candidatus Aminicenantes bacterium]|nr:PilZ domain-containing protein [Candidatus Aminicenantes bacterium]